MNKALIMQIVVLCTYYLYRKSVFAVSFPEMVFVFLTSIRTASTSLESVVEYANSISLTVVVASHLHTNVLLHYTSVDEFHPVVEQSGADTTSR
jgi:hypothetical protein